MNFKIDYIFSNECPAPCTVNPNSNCLRCDYFQKLTQNINSIEVVCTYLEWNQEPKHNKHE